MMNNKIKIMAFAALLLASNAYTQAASVKNFNTTASLTASCRFTGTDVDFGSYNPNMQDYQYSMQNIGIFCTKGTPFKIASDANGADRFVTYAVIHNTTNTAQTLKYQIYANDGVWSDDIFESQHQYSGNGTGALQNLSINYRLMPNQYVAPGNYSGTNTLILSF